VAALILAVAILLFIALPIVSLFLKISPSRFFVEFKSSVVLDALKLSLITTFISALIIVVLGTPLAYINARYHYRGKHLVDTIMDLPVVIPPAVSGIALLMAFGRMGIIGQYLNMAGITIGFSSIAVIMAQIFVASPFYIRQAKNSFEDVDSIYEDAARTLGATSFKTFIYITVPMALNGIVSGLMMSWARALGEFGATILFAGNFQGTTQTMPLAIYTIMQSDMDAAIALSVILVIISFMVIALIKLLAEKADITGRS
jgi:molybdate transport system permease protein